MCEIKSLQNMPPNILTISKFVSYAKSLCSNNKLMKLNILEINDLKKLNMNLMMFVDVMLIW